MKMAARYRNTWLIYLYCFCSLYALSTACDTDHDCNEYFDGERCCHGTCISKDSSCISGAAIAGIVIGCLIIGGIIISCCLCFCCACGPFQNRSQGTVIRYGGHVTQTTTTGISSYPTTNVQAGYGASYPQPSGVAHVANTVSHQGKYPQPGAAPYPSAVNGNSPAYPPTAPPSYDEANNPPPYNPGYPE